MEELNTIIFLEVQFCPQLPHCEKMLFQLCTWHTTEIYFSSLLSTYCSFCFGIFENELNLQCSVLMPRKGQRTSFCTPQHYWIHLIIYIPSWCIQIAKFNYDQKVELRYVGKFPSGRLSMLKHPELINYLYSCQPEQDLCVLQCSCIIGERGEGGNSPPPNSDSASF